MNDPHVESLTYRFGVLDRNHDYSGASAWDGLLGDFDAHLEGDVLLATTRAHFASENEARAALEPLLLSWELRADLEDNLAIRFSFENARVVDRRPTSGHIDVHVNAAAAIATAGEVTIRIGHNSFPHPSRMLLAEDALVRDLRATVHEIRSGQQRLLVAAYLFLTRLEYEYGSRSLAAKGAAVSEAVLSKIGELSIVNDPRARRKVKGPERLLTEAERRWLDETIRRITLQVAQIATGESPTQLTMTNLPIL